MKLSQEFQSLSSLLDATEAATNWRALFLGAGTVILSILLLGALAAANNPPLMILGGLLVGAILLYGFCAVGIMLMDAARGETSRPVGAALVTSLLSSHRLLGIGIISFLLFLAALAISYALLFLCRVPGFGAVLSFFIMPSVALFLGLTFFALAYIVAPLSGAAVWSGEPLTRILSILDAIVRQRFLSVIIQLILMTLIAGVIFGVVATILGVGTLMAGGVGFSSATSLFSPRFGMGMGFGADPMDMAMGFLTSRMSAGGAGMTVLTALAFMLPGLVLIQGICQIYLGLLPGLDFNKAEERLKNKLEQARRTMEEARRKAEEATAQSRQTAIPISLSLESPKCPSCGQPLEPDSAFCGNCGRKQD